MDLSRFGFFLLLSRSPVFPREREVDLSDIEEKSRAERLVFPREREVDLSRRTSLCISKMYGLPS